MSMKLAAVALSLLAVLLASGAAADEDPVRPFHAELVGFPNITPVDQCTFLNHPTAEGNATHLGSASFSAVEIIDVCTLFPRARITSTFVLTAANGDEVHGGIDVILTQNPDGSAVATGSYTITGGTGRFEDATGSGTWTVTFASQTSPAVVVADGTIAY